MSMTRVPIHVRPVWTPADAVDTAQAFAAELAHAERGTSSSVERQRQSATKLGSRLMFGRSRFRRARIYDALAVTLLMIVMACLGVVVYAASARADTATADAWAAEYGPAACDVLDAAPTLRTLTGVLAADVGMGATPVQAGEDVATAVWQLCPRHVPLLHSFVAIYGGRRAA